MGCVEYSVCGASDKPCDIKATSGSINAKVQCSGVESYIQNCAACNIYNYQGPAQMSAEDISVPKCSSSFSCAGSSAGYECYWGTDLNSFASSCTTYEADYYEGLDPYYKPPRGCSDRETGWTNYWTGTINTIFKTTKCVVDTNYYKRSCD